MGAPKGNQNARRAKLARDALHRRMVARYGSVEAGYDANADKKLDAQERGEQWAIQDIAWTSDGKPAQAIVGDAEADPVQIQEIAIRAVGDRPSDESESDASTESQV